MPEGWLGSCYGIVSIYPLLSPIGTGLSGEGAGTYDAEATLAVVSLAVGLAGLVVVDLSCVRYGVPNGKRIDKGRGTYGLGTTATTGTSGNGRAGEEERGEDGELHCVCLERS